MNTFQTITGGCLCGAIRYTLTKPPKTVAYCHCRNCQLASGATTIAWAGFETSSLQITQGSPAHYQSSPYARREFCSQCGTQLFFSYLQRTEEIDVTVGSIDNPDRLQPSYHIWVKRCPSWLRLQDNLPQYEEDGPDFNPAKQNE